jgi:aminopeptidase N
VIASVPNLTRDDARVRGELLQLESYDVVLDLTDGAGAPSDRTFRSTTTITFAATRPGASTFLDIVAESVRRVTLNGKDVPIGDYEPADGIVLPDLEADNIAVVEADMLYTNTGEGLHRFVDPVDNEVYLYSQFETADAKRVYACFDQPDLKAAFILHVTAPAHWDVVSNGRERSVDQSPAGKTVHFAPTPRLSPYVTAVVAGPYHVVRDHHDGIDLGVFCRRSLAEYLDADDIFTVTKQGFDWYHANFGLRYAFDKYDQLFVPEFNAGAMENAACVTFLEDYIFRGKVTDARFERRGDTILHEMAHMWFGDLVTMRWWNDLWLNESFANFAAPLAQAEATRWTHAWTTFANVEKAWAYRQDQQPTTHPIATDAPDVQTAEVNFDGITYAKGASVLKQLVAYVGTKEFLAGLRQYFHDHAYGNTTLADLLAALETTSGRDLRQWSTAWLETAGINTIRPEFDLDANERYASFELVQTAPTDVAESNVLRPHRLAIGLYHHDADSGQLVRTGRFEVDVTGERTPIPALVGVAQPDLLLANDDDLTYCKLRLDDRSLRILRAGGIARLAESLPRALCWSAAWDMTRDGELATRDYVALVVAGARSESDVGLLQTLNAQALRAVQIYADPAWAPQGYQMLAVNAVTAMWEAEPGSDHQLAWAHAFLAAARSAEHTAEIRALYSGENVPPGLAVDAELRWAIVQSLSARDALSDAEIEAELARDPSATGQRHAVTARAMAPNPAAKTEAWRLAIEDGTVPNATQRAAIVGFNRTIRDELLAPYVTRYFADIPGLWARRTSELAQNAVVGLFPTWPSTISPETVRAVDDFLDRSDLAAALRRLVREGRADIVRALAARSADAAGGPVDS